MFGPNGSPRWKIIVVVLVCIHPWSCTQNTLTHSFLLVQGGATTTPSESSSSSSQRGGDTVLPLAMIKKTTTPDQQQSSSSSSSSLQQQQKKKKKKPMSTLISHCACGKVTLRIQIPSSPPCADDDDQQQQQESIVQAVDCHCPACRKYHVAAFASYLRVPAENVDMDFDNTNNNDDLQVFRESCQQLGPVQRFFCRHCYTKMATKPVRANEVLETTMTTKDQQEEVMTAIATTDPASSSITAKSASPTMVLINMGGLVDKSIPQVYQKAWRGDTNKGVGRIPWQQQESSSSQKAGWTTALPLQQRPRTMPPLVTTTPTTTTTGSCACGQCQYQIRHVPYELQHCYCRLCRQFCGSAYQSWIPVMNEDFRWQEKEPSSSSLVLKRTTEHGKRHFCTTCGSCLTIVYDDQPDMIWPAAGGLDDVSLPTPMDPYLDRVCHICCAWKPSWYTLPNDGMDRIKYAS
jgi:hypothetical protein